MVISLKNLKPAVRRRKIKRLGRGNASGQGTFSGRGSKGQHARSGSSTRPGFEGGRTTLIMQTTKARGRGFHSLQVKPVALNVESLNRFSDNDVISVKSLIQKGMVKSGPVKILGDGELKKKLEVHLPVSASAKKKIEKAGGRVFVGESKN